MKKNITTELETEKSALYYQETIKTKVDVVCNRC